MPPKHDAYGRLLLAHLEGEPSEEVMERDDGYVYCGDPSDYFAPRRRWPSTERRALRFARGRVLDVPRDVFGDAPVLDGFANAELSGLLDRRSDEELLFVPIDLHWDPFG